MKKHHSLCLWGLLVLAALVSASAAQGKEITDMFGRKFSIATRPGRVYSPSPTMTNLLYAIDPSMLAGLTVPVREYEKPYLKKEMLSLPVLGGWYGQGNMPNMEMILKVNAELIILVHFSSAFHTKTNEAIMKALSAPIVSVSLATVYDYPPAITDLGRLLGREERANELAAYAQKTIAEMKAFTAGIGQREKVSVYYAEGVDGLNTDCDSSMHTELIPLAGGRNVHSCVSRSVFGMEKISMEQVMLYDPDVILAFEGAFYRFVFNDLRWQRLRAVKNKRVHLIPNQPFNWFDRPPSFMRLLGD
ncbi:MAG: ABC transporter substrate-binding protein, partial [Geobacteraceae bacterium]|nr:ABC transporter substrate-binding protein [Geobacteraceae bacterium]